jgi:hypothetical protein
MENLQIDAEDKKKIQEGSLDPSPECNRQVSTKTNVQQIAFLPAITRAVDVVLAG